MQSLHQTLGHHGGVFEGTPDSCFTHIPCQITTADLTGWKCEKYFNQKSPTFKVNASSSFLITICQERNPISLSGEVSISLVIMLS